MRRLAQWLAVAMLGWFVVTFSGQPVSGPSMMYGDCLNTANQMTQRYQNVSSYCQMRSP